MCVMCVTFFTSDQVDDKGRNDSLCLQEKLYESLFHMPYNFCASYGLLSIVNNLYTSVALRCDSVDNLDQEDEYDIKDVDDKQTQNKESDTHIQQVTNVEHVAQETKKTI